MSDRQDIIKHLKDVKVPYRKNSTSVIAKMTGLTTTYYRWMFTGKGRVSIANSGVVTAREWDSLNEK